jgi:hypothetical protein
LTVVVGVPAAVGHLAIDQVLDAAGLLVEVDVAGPVHEGDDIGDQRGIDQELANPVAFGFLLGKKKLLRARDGVLRGIGKRFGDRLAKGREGNLNGLLGQDTQAGKDRKKTLPRSIRAEKG